MPKITLPDGTSKDYPDGVTTRDVAEGIGPGLLKAALAGCVSTNGQNDWETLDLNRPLPGDRHLRVLTEKSDDADTLYLIRHSAAHVMAEAICKLYPQAKLVYGPPIEDGFYYDIDLDEPITPEAFPKIEAEMAKVVAEDRPFTRLELSREEGLKKVRAEGNRYKVDNAERADGDTLSFYVTGEHINEDFEDLCRGPHVPSTG